MPLGRGSNRSVAGDNGRSRSSSGDRDCCYHDSGGTRGAGRNHYNSDRFRDGQRPHSAWAGRDSPGGNVTGVTSMIVEITPKRLELLHEAMPKAGVMILLVNPEDR